MKEKGLKLSITEGGKKDRAREITSCKYLEERFQECSKKGVLWVTSVESLGAELRMRTEKLGAMEKARRKKCDVRISLIGNYRDFQKITWELV